MSVEKGAKVNYAERSIKLSTNIEDDSQEKEKSEFYVNKLWQS